MSSYKIIIKIEENLFENSINKKLTYYTTSNKYFSDSISFENQNITISGSRSKKIKNDNILETTNSTYYAVMIKSLLFVYFKFNAFKVNDISVKIDEKLVKTYTSLDICQIFGQNCEIQISTDKLFGIKKTSDLLMISLMNLTLSFNKPELQFDYTWKSFNALIREIFQQKKDFYMLKELKEDLEKSLIPYPAITDFIDNMDNMDNKFIQTCMLNKMICNNYPKNSKNKPEDFFNSFNDYRVAEILKDKMECKKDYLTKKNKYSNIKEHYEKCISDKTKKDSDVIRILILKYAYYLRCKYFHAEKIPTNFLINNFNQKELNRISEPLKLICKDLIENKL